MIFVKDAKDLRFVRFNKAGQNLLGLPAGDLIGKSDFDLFPAEQANHFVAKDRDVLAGRQVVEILEEPIMTARQGLRYLHTRKIPLLDEDGKPEYLLGISEDITKKKEAEENRLRAVREEIILKEREESARQALLLSRVNLAMMSSLDYRLALEGMAGVIIPEICDWCAISVAREDGRFERVVTKHPDLSFAPLMDQLSSSSPLSGDSAVLVSPANDEDLRRHYPGDEQFRTLKELGVRHFMLVPVTARDKNLGIISLFRAGERGFGGSEKLFAEELGRRAGLNIENAFLYEKAQQAIEARDQFFSVASHELKTPLASLQLLVGLAQRSGDVNFLAGAKLDRFKRQLDRLTNLVDDLLDVTRMQAGKVTYNFEHVNLAGLVRDVLDRYREPMLQAGCVPQLDLDDKLVANADAGRIEQVIINLLSNAVKYAPGRPVEIQLSKRGAMAELSVKDHGPGIAGDQRELVF